MPIPMVIATGVYHHGDNAPTSDLAAFSLGLDRNLVYEVSRMSLLLGSVRNWLDAGLGFFYPETCQLCGEARATPADGFVCAGCRGQARFIQPPLCERCGLPWEGEITSAFECTNCREMKFHFRSARAAVKAQGTVLEAIHRYKYHRAFWFEGFLAELLIRQAAPVLEREKWDFIGV